MNSAHVARSSLGAESDRRRRPRVTDTDWLVLSRMNSVIEGFAQKIGDTGKISLDFGCGSRPYEPIFTNLGCAYVGADLGKDSDVEIDSSGRVAISDESADLVLSFQVLEHVRDVDTYLSEAARVIRRDGWLLLSTHGTWLYHPHPEDHRRWTREGLVAEIERHGFEVAATTPVVGPLAWTTVLRLTCWAYALNRIPLVGRALTAVLALIMNARAVVEELVTPAWVTNENACVYVTLSRRRLSS
jgi:SAM-dependent methyltransferase